MNIFGWFKNDLKDLTGEGENNKREIDSLVKSYGKKAKEKSSSAANKLTKKLAEQKAKREEKKEDKKNSGDTTSDDISKNRKKILWKYGWKALIGTFVIIILTALFRTITMDNPSARPKKAPVTILEGIESEDDDYFESRMSKTVSDLAQTIKGMKTASQDKENAAQKALLEEAKKNKMLEEKLKKMELKIDEAKKNEDNSSVVADVKRKMYEMSKRLEALLDRPSSSNINHGISPLPSADGSTTAEESILVSPPKNPVKLTVKEEAKIRKKVKHASHAIKKEYEYSEISIETLSQDTSIVDSALPSDKKVKPPLHIMTGFAKATLITGVDAPTFGGGKANPVPVILSLDTQEIIANGFDSNLEDCMLIGQAFGNMNTMRAEIEVTRLSCNIEIEGVLYKIEEGVKAWVYGENGIHGVRGRLVDSAGKILTKEIAVGFLQGVATAFAQPQSTIQAAGGIPYQVFQTDNLKNAGQRGAAEGVSNGLNALSEYYTKLLDGSFPFISVRSGRSVTILFKGGEDVKMTPYSRVDVASDGGDDEIDGLEVSIDGW